MAYQMTITLSDQEYTTLKAEAAKRGLHPEMFLHEFMTQRLRSPFLTTQPMTGHEFMEQQYREGKVLNIPTRRSLTQEERAERERLGQVFAGGKPLSEMVIEDRGPY